MKDWQLFVLSGNIFLAGSFLTNHLWDSIAMGVLFCVWFGMAVFSMGRKE